MPQHLSQKGKDGKGRNKEVFSMLFSEGEVREILAVHTGL